MKTTCLRTALVMALASLGGCSGSDPSPGAEAPVESFAATSINPAAPAIAGLTSSTSAAPPPADKIEPFRNPFAPPKDPPPPPVVKEPEPKPNPEPEPAPEIRPPGTPPKIRLLGFVNTGEPKVVVSYRKVPHTLQIGDKLEDLTVVKIEAPNVIMLFEENELTFSLFDQPWAHEGGAASANDNDRTPIRSRTSSFGSTSGEPPRPSGIPGFGPNAGKPPGFQPPTAPGQGSTPGGATRTPPPKLPGLEGKSVPGESVDGEVDIFGLDVNAAFGLPPAEPAGP